MIRRPTATSGSRGPAALRRLGVLPAAAAAATAVLVGVAPPALACSCAAPPPGETEAARQESYDLVFTGRVIDRQQHSETSASEEGMVLVMGSEVTWTFDVEGVAKGDVVDPQPVVSSDQSSACGYRFAQGERFHVYAGRGTDGRAHVNLCSPTRLAHEEPPLTPGGAAPATTLPRAVAPGEVSATTAPPATGFGATIPTVAPGLPRTTPTTEGIATGEPLGGLDRTGIVLLASLLAGVMAASVTVAWQHDPPFTRWEPGDEGWEWEIVDGD